MTFVKDDKIACWCFCFCPHLVYGPQWTIEESGNRGKVLGWQSINLLQYERWVILVSSPNLPRRSIHITVPDIYCSYLGCMSLDTQTEDVWCEITWKCFSALLFNSNLRVVTTLAINNLTVLFYLYYLSPRIEFVCVFNVTSKCYTYCPKLYLYGTQRTVEKLLQFLCIYSSCAGAVLYFSLKNVFFF